MNILVSACLLGVHCRYNGEGKMVEELKNLLDQHHLIPVCPEQLGGLMTPREPSECLNGKVVSKTGEDVTKYFDKGAEEVLLLAKLYKCNYAILKERSPSCGTGKIYDGTFTGKIIEGDGVTAQLLREHGIIVMGETEIADFIRKVS
ncbi:MAG: hypothetical protein K0S47_1014 [Herbinix sp.]|jgi:uncharacterized protein YbbK (DUF523 family)|nr:hypothetical protein [Herbinix sp.]